MKLNFFYLLLLLSVVFHSCKNRPAIDEIELNQGWEFKSTDQTVWGAAEVPGTVHTDLIASGVIKDPFFRMNEHDLQWIDKKDWVYQTTFDVSEAFLAKEMIELNFDGLDTYASVYLNDSLVLKTDNMFRSYEVSVKGVLKQVANNLKVLFESPIKIGIKKHDALGYKFPDLGNDLATIGKVEGDKQVSIFSRKASYHFGWDWGPRLVTSGIWKPVTLKSWNQFKIEDVFIRQKHLESSVQLTAEVDAMVFDSDFDKAATVDIYVNDKHIKSMALELEVGLNQLKVPFTIQNPNLWWPNGMGDQTLYNVKAKVSNADYSDSKSHDIGLRTIELIQEPDSIGTSFYFKVNGHPVFMKGSNYIPQDIFLTRPKIEDYDRILSAAQNSNMNMIRVWGGGVYESDTFYQMCDQKGLLVWQDFMFACAMYPGDAEFLETVKQEAIDNVKRLRNHPSIALWCGNNENLSAWENWGWKGRVEKNQSKAIADTMWNSYEDLFHKILPEVISSYDSDRNYWPSSPGSAFGKPSNMENGDMHYWKVWWGKKPFEDYEKDIPRFMSEFGFQSFPEFSSVKQYALPEDYDVYSDVMTSHQRSSIGNETIEEYMLRDYRKPKDFESFLYVSQLLQARGIKIGIEAHRRHRDRCMGTLYWQINDCWPVASWSSIDYYGKWKALQYAVKKTFKTFLISQEVNNEQLQFFVVSDTLQPKDALLEIKLINFDGTLLEKWKQEIKVKPNQSKIYFELPLNVFSKYGNLNNILIDAKLVSKSSNILADNYFYFKSPKLLKLSKPQISYTIEENKNQFELVIKTDKLAKDVFVSTNSLGNLSDNYFDLLPGYEKIIKINKDQIINVQSFESSIKIVSLWDSY